jgi:hypothetical protein
VGAAPPRAVPRPSSLDNVHFDFRFQNSNGKWESAGNRRGEDRPAAIEAMSQATPGGLRPGHYMSRPRSRQKDWDLFSVDPDGQIRLPR